MQKCSSTMCCTTNSSCDASVYAAFFMEGMRDRDYDAVIRSWDQGCIELVSEIVMFAWLLVRLVDAAVLARNDSFGFPGVLAYEVCNPFGQWIADHVIDKSEMPSEQECAHWLATEVIAFFSQGEDAKHIAAITAAVNVANSAPQPSMLATSVGNNTNEIVITM